MYRCTDVVEGESIAEYCTLYIFKPESILCTDVVEGESIYVQCTAKDGVPSARVYWQYPGQKLQVKSVLKVYGKLHTPLECLYIVSTGWL